MSLGGRPREGSPREIPEFSGVSGIFHTSPGISMAVARSRFATLGIRCDPHISHCNTGLFSYRRDSSMRFGIKTGTNLHHLGHRPTVGDFRASQIFLRVSIATAREPERAPMPAGIERSAGPLTHVLPSMLAFQRLAPQRRRTAGMREPAPAAAWHSSLPVGPPVDCPLGNFS